MKNRSCLMHILSVFLELRRQKETPRPVKKEEQRAEPQLSDADVVEPIPRTIKQDKTGQVKIEGETIPNSNISDLVSDAMRSRKDFNPTGAKKFFQALSKLNVPKHLERNQNRWKQLNNTLDVSTPNHHRYPALSLSHLSSLSGP